MLRVGNVSAFGRQALGRDKPCPYGCETHGFILRRGDPCGRPGLDSTEHDRCESMASRPQPDLETRAGRSRSE